MAYTPELSRDASATLRRIAWHRKAPMTRTLEAIVQEAVQQYGGNEICMSCRDKTKCRNCWFRDQPMKGEKR